MPKSHSWIRHEQEVRVPLSRQRRPKLRAPSSSFPYRVFPTLDFTPELPCKKSRLNLARSQGFAADMGACPVADLVEG